MILDPTTDEACLGQLTYMARELAPTTLMRTVAARLGTPTAVVAWLQSLPQTDDNGDELYRFVSCDVPQRVRLLPDDPNCFERAFAAIALLEVLDPKTTRMLVTIDRPLRHTGVVEWKSNHWLALDLFPRRNFDWGNFGKDVLQGTHQYVGKPVLSFYGMGGAADSLGEYEDKAIGRDKKNEKKQQPPAQQKPQQPQQQPKQQQQPGKAQQQPKQQQLAGIDLGRFFGSGAKGNESNKGGHDVEAKERKPELPTAGALPAGGTVASDGDGHASEHEPAPQTKRLWGWI